MLLVGLIWLALMTYICYRGIEVSANMQKGLLAIEAGMLVVFAAVALLKVATGNAPKPATSTRRGAGSTRSTSRRSRRSSPA